MLAPMATTSNTPALAEGAAAKGSGLVLATLAVGQFLMALDSSVMNVSIAYVANDLGTTVTGVQTAITMYTLVMATLMITGGKVGAMIGRRRAFAIGCLVYGAGSLTTAVAPNLPVLLFGWSFLEGVGAALIMPAIVALVAGNFPPQGRARAYGLITAAGAMAVAVGPLIGGALTTYASWRWVFAGEVVIVLGILGLSRKIADAPVERRPHLDIVGVVLTIAGLGALVYGVLMTGTWGWITPKPDAPALLGLSLSLWLIFGGLLVSWLFVLWEHRRKRLGKEPLVDLRLFENRQLRGGLVMFFFQYMVQLGTFFVIPLFLSVVLELSAVATGVRLLPLSIALLIAAGGIPRIWPAASPRRVVRVGLLLMFLGIMVLVAGLDPGANAGVVAIPLFLLGLGIGALASQLGAVTVSAVPDEQSSDVGGLQNTALNLGSSLGTALIGSVLIASLTSAFLSTVMTSSEVPQSVKDQATVQLASGAPFISETQLRAGLEETDLSQAAVQDIVDANASAQLSALRTSLSVAAGLSVVALFFTGRIPTRPPGRKEGAGDDGEDEVPDEAAPPESGAAQAKA